MENRFLSEWMRYNDLTNEEFMKLHDFERFDHQDFSEAADTVRFIETLHGLKGTRRIVIDSDYDVDGIMSEEILKASLRKFGFNVSSYYPTEHDGYGLTMKEAHHLLEKFPDVTAIITADNGINCKEAIDYLSSLGISVLVSDHHRGEIDKFPSSAEVCVNVNRSDKTDLYRFKHISGAQTAYKLMDLYARTYESSQVQSYIKCLKVFASISILSDVMLIDNENRRDVKDLIADFNSKRLENMSLVNEYVKRLKTFVDKFGSGRITAETFGFAVIPTLNSARRMLGESELAYKVFDENAKVAEVSTNALMRLNDLRKAEKREAMSMIDLKVDTDQIAIAVTTAKGGILGLIASDLANSAKRSSLAFKEVNGRMKASGRGFAGNSIYRILEEVKDRDDSIDFGFGGHSHALGCEVAIEDFERFCQIAKECSEELYHDLVIESDPSVEVSLSEILDSKDFLIELKYASDMIDLIRPLPYYLKDLKLSCKTSLSEINARGFEYFGKSFEHLKLERPDLEIVCFFNADKIKSAKSEFELIMNVRHDSSKCMLVIDEVNTND